MALVLTLLSGKAALWGTAVWENRHPCCSSFHALSEEMRRVFDRAVVGREAARRLADLCQGERSVSDFSIEFRALAAECKWNEEAQWDMFLHGLADRIQGEMFSRELPTSLDGLIDLALRVDSRLQQRDQRDHQSLPVTQDYLPIESGRTVSHRSDSEPMQVGRARLSREERERRRRGGLCLYCGASSKSASPAVERRLLSGGVSFNQSSNTTLLPVRLQWAAGSYDGSALLDSGAEGSFMDRNLVHQLQISTTSLRHKIPVSALNVQSLPDITHSTLPVTLITSGNHTETMTFYPFQTCRRSIST